MKHRLNKYGQAMRLHVPPPPPLSLSFSMFISFSL